MFKSKKQIIRNDDDIQYKDLCYKAYEKYSDDKLKQLEYIEENGSSQFYVMKLLEIVQSEFSLPSNNGLKFEFQNGGIDCLFRAFLDAVRHMQSDLPDGVYHFIRSNLEGFSKQALKQTEGFNDK